MKRLFSLLILLTCMTMTYAQGTLVATLNHNDTVSIYYGMDALIRAHSAAVTGDVITLSPGTFTSTNITKAITLRGAGMQEDSILGCKPTVLTGDITVGSSSGEILNGLTIEGIYHNSRFLYNRVTNAVFAKSRFNSITSQYGESTSESSYIRNSTFIHCRIANGLSLINNSFISCLNCAVNLPWGRKFHFVNCLILFKGSNNSASSVSESTYENCIIYGSSTTDYLTESCMAYNCVNPMVSTLFNKIPNSTNMHSTSVDVFKTYAGQDFAKLDNETFELTDSAKVTFLGTDGTQVGIYGGALPFDLTPTVPQIKKFNVAPKSTADGKLKVDIEVSAAAEEPKW